jgi:hypothetical protein
MRFLHLIVLGLLLCGCVNSKRVVINPSTGEQRDCSVQGWGWLGTPVALASQKACLDQAKALGFVGQDEAKFTEPATFDEVLTPPTAGVDAPRWEVGETWEVKKGENLISRKVTEKKVHEFENAYVVTFTMNGAPAGRQIYTESLSTMEIVNAEGQVFDFEPPNKTYSWPMRVGDKWRATGQYITPTGQIQLATDRRVTGFGKVKTPAGTFEAFHILSESTNGGRVSEAWYAPEVRNEVKSIVYTAGGRVLEELTSYTLGGKTSSVSASELGSKTLERSAPVKPDSKLSPDKKLDAKQPCSPDQIIQMIRMGMTDGQVKAACK